MTGSTPGPGGYAGTPAPAADSPPAGERPGAPEQPRHSGTTAAGEAAAYEIVRVGTHNWRTYRDVRLACLIESAPWFGTTYPQAARLSDDDWKARAMSPTLTFWLAMADDFPLGTAGLAIDGAGEAGTLIGMWVVPRVRGTGVAQALVEQVRAEARRRGCLRFELHVDALNARAQGFYRRLGFEESGLIAGAAGERDEVVMADRAF